MEGGEKAQIQLDKSGLDIRTSDMMSQLSDPKLEHNRQCWQGKMLPTSLRFEHDGWAAGRQVWQFPFDGDRMGYCCTDVDEEDLEAHEVAKCTPSREMQFLRQQWDTTDAVENFWWVDPTHVILLTKDAFVLRVKDGGLDDWAGDTFIEENRWPRHSIIDANIKAYLVSSAYGGERARLITIGIQDYGFRITVYDTLTMLPFQNIISIGKRSLGQTLCADASHLWSYSSLIPLTMATQGKWSATCRNGCLVLGLHYDNNFNQWAMTFDLSSGGLLRIVQGYGFVGVDGSLTGGEIPSYCFSAGVGFTGAVSPMSSLSGTNIDDGSISDAKSCASRIVGTEEQQWYIRNNVPSIVSHLVMSGSGHYAVDLPINNNYSCDYGSGSFKSMVISDYAIRINSFLDFLLDDESRQTKQFIDLLDILIAFASGGTLSIFSLRPSILTANYLQQTLGQASYVHYNSTSIYQPKDLKNESVVRNYTEEEWTHDSENRPRAEPISEDEVSFDRVSVKQHLAIKFDEISCGILAILSTALVSALDYGENKLRVNSVQNQTSTSDTGRRFSQFFLHNMASLVTSDMNARSVMPENNSEVTAIKTLDMFYSTSDQQKICAGRGYVNHNFVAQCVSQSVTSVQSDFSHQRIIWIIKSLTLAFIDAAMYILRQRTDVLKVTIDAYSGPDLVGQTSSPTSTGLKTAALTEYTIESIVLLSLNYLRDIFDEFMEGTGMTTLHSSVAGFQTRHAYDVEGKHRYGSKSECFMWPCFGVGGSQSVVDEGVDVTLIDKSWDINFTSGAPYFIPPNQYEQAKNTTWTQPEQATKMFDGTLAYFIAMIKGRQSNVSLPERMAYAIGAESFLPANDFKNENIGESEPVFPTPPFQDYMIENDFGWGLSQTASVGMTTWVSCGDTKLIDGEFSNIVVSGGFCGVASPYTAIEVKKGIKRKYLRPWAITPNALALNNTGLNCCYEKKAYHAFDGQGYRVVSWMGSPGMNKEKQTWLYSFLLNDRFKRDNKLPQNEYLGNYKSEPVVALQGNADDKVFTLVTRPGENEGFTAGAIGEDKDSRRYSAPIFSEFVSTLPAAVKTITAYPFDVIDGVTSLTSGNRDLQTAYKAPLSVDFTIGKQSFRYTQDYICELKMERGVTVTTDVVPCLGLTYIGSTPYEAYLYSQDTKMYYRFRGNGGLEKVDMIERFRNVRNGRYDFVRQEVLMPCLATFERIDRNVHDDDNETDNVMIPRLIDGEFAGEVWPPIETIYNTRSWFRTLSLPCGVTYQGPNRCIINRFTYQSYMGKQIRANYGLWRKVPREEYHPFREYAAKYERVDVDIGDLVKVKGWTHNPFLLVTAPLGVNDETDCLFEWEITFCWPVEMDELYGKDDYAVVNIQSQTMTPGGKVVANRPTHVFLTKELFTRTGNYGYYSFRYQGKSGIGNRERLHIWSDQYIAVSGLQCEYKVMSQKRTEILTQQLDVERLHEI